MDKCSYPEGFEDFINARYAEPWFNEPHKFTHVRGIELARLAWLAATDRERKRCVEVTWSARCTTGAGDDGFYLAVGRIVHFNDNDSTCQAAIVTLVRPGDFEPVDLTVFPNGGGASHQGNVIHVDQPRSWHWPWLCQTYRHKTAEIEAQCLCYPVQPAQKDAACPYGITDCGCTKPHSNTQWCHGCRHWCVGEYCARICPHPPGTTSPAKAESGKD